MVVRPLQGFILYPFIPVYDNRLVCSGYTLRIGSVRLVMKGGVGG